MLSVYVLYKLCTALLFYVLIKLGSRILLAEAKLTFICCLLHVLLINTTNPPSVSFGIYDQVNLHL